MEAVSLLQLQELYLAGERSRQVNVCLLIYEQRTIMIDQLLVLQWCAPSSMFLSMYLNAAITINSSKHDNHGKFMTSTNKFHELNP